MKTSILRVANAPIGVFVFLSVAWLMANATGITQVLTLHTPASSLAEWLGFCASMAATVSIACVVTFLCCFHWNQQCKAMATARTK